MVNKSPFPEAGMSLFIYHKESVFCSAQNSSILKVGRMKHTPNHQHLRSLPIDKHSELYPCTRHSTFVGIFCFQLQ